MPTILLRIEHAAQKYDLPEQKIKALIKEGQLKSYRLDEDPECILVKADQVAAIAADYLIKRDQFQHLDGTPIGVSQAALKYGFHVGTVSQWIEEGHIREMGRDPQHKQRRLINEADVAYAAALRDLKGIRQGQSLWS